MISRVRLLEVKNSHEEFAKYCELLNGSEFEVIAVESSIYGSYARTLEFATKNYYAPSPVIIEPQYRVELLKKMGGVLNDTSSSPEEKIYARRILGLLNRGRNLDSLFQNMEMGNAKAFIVAAAKEFHFLLLNEAHYSTQNRIFTESLLQPLWDVGYRYLALETLNERDSMLTQRGYPTNDTGFYTRDPAFANMVRKALQLGYKLIPYETNQNVDGTSRDRDQAKNIFNRTYRNDQLGKVLVHAGYSHISEKGDDAYRPMGEQLRELFGNDILTVDQQTMTELGNTLKENVYYKFAEEKYRFKEPVIFRFGDVIFVDPIHRGTVDIQIFHPRTTFVYNRPTWLLRDNFKNFMIPEQLKRYQGHLLQAFKKSEPLHAIPIDQFIIDEDIGFVLPKGEYILRIIDCMGTLKFECEMSVPE